MTTSPELGPAGVTIPVDLAAVLAAPLRRLVLEDSRRRGVVLPVDVVAVLDLLDVCRRAVAADAAPPARRPQEAPAPSWWPTVAETAARLGVTRQAVEARLRRGTLAGRRDAAGRVRVDPADLEVDAA